MKAAARSDEQEKDKEGIAISKGKIGGICGGKSMRRSKSCGCGVNWKRRLSN